MLRIHAAPADHRGTTRWLLETPNILDPSFLELLEQDFIQFWETEFGVDLVVQWLLFSVFSNVYFQNSELQPTVDNAFLVEIALPIAKWELM